MKKNMYYHFALILIFSVFNINVALSAAPISTHPFDGYTGVPTSMSISVKFDEPIDPATVIVELDPLVSGTLDYYECDILSYYYSGGYPVYRDLEHCYSLVFTPSVDLSPGTSYMATVSGGGVSSPYSWFFTTDYFRTVLGEIPVKTYLYPSRHKPAVAMNSRGEYVVVWQDSSEGIKAQLYDSSGIKTGTEYSIASSAYYSDAHGPSVAMNDIGEFVVGWMDNYGWQENFQLSPLTTINYYVRKYPDEVTNTITHNVPSYIYDHIDDYEFQFS